MEHQTHLQDSLDYIEEHLRAELTVGELAALTGYSASHYSRLFREAIGMSVGHYILRRRLLHAGYDPTAAERKAAPLVLLGSQLVCVAWFAEQEKYRSLFEINKRITQWLLEHFDELR